MNHLALPPHPLPDIANRESTLAEPVSTYRMLLASAFAFTLILGVVISVKTFNIHGLALPGGTVVFPLAFSILVIVSEVYGLRTSWRMAVTGIVLLFLLVIIIDLAIALPGDPLTSRQAHEFADLYGTPPRVFLAVMLGFALGQAAGLGLLHLGGRLFAGRLLWLRICGVPMVAQIVTIAIALPVALWGIASPDVMASILWNRALLAFFQSSLVAPFLFWAILGIRRRERHQTPENDRAAPSLISESTVTITPDSIIVEANSAFAAMFDCPDPVGRPLTDFMPERLRAAHLAGVARYRDTGTRTLNWANVPVTGVRADGREIALLVSFIDRVTDPPRLTGIIRFAGELAPGGAGQIMKEPR